MMLSCIVGSDARSDYADNLAESETSIQHNSMLHGNVCDVISSKRRQCGYI